MSSETLLAKIADNPHIPMPPAVALQVLERASRPTCSIEEIGELIRLDPLLCGKVLKTVNSAQFGLRRAVTSIDRALRLLGLRPVRSLVLSLSLPAMQRQTPADARTQEYWKSSVIGAIAARELAIKLRRPEPEDDLVAGLLRDLGVIILQQLYPEQYAHVDAAQQGTMADNLCEMEERILGLNHAELSAFLLRRWRLPDEITEAVRFHHDLGKLSGASAPVAQRTLLLHFATKAAQLQSPICQPEVVRQLVEFAANHLQIEEEELVEILQPVTQKTQEFAALLEVDIGQCTPYASVLAKATEELVRLTIEANVQELKAREEKKQTEKEVRRWRRVAQRLHQEVMRDHLTGVYNRAFFDETLANEFKRARRRCSLLGLVFIDLDGFKAVNDERGHLFGDQVLQEVADLLRREARPGDVIARYGGDEFCLIVADTSNQELTALANRLSQTLNRFMIGRSTGNGEIGASIGAALCFPYGSTSTPKDFLAQADQAMYAAKAAGKNRVHLVSLLTESDGLLLEEIRKRLFSVFLWERYPEPRQQILETARLLTAPRERIGRLARRLRWIGPHELRSVLHEQRRSKRMFGEIALCHRHLSREMLCSLLAIQRERPEELAESLIHRGILAEGEVQKQLKAYYQQVVSLGAPLPS